MTAFLLLVVVLGGAGLVAGGLLIIAGRRALTLALGWTLAFFGCCCLVSACMLLAITPVAP